jgi:hypothetical protein
MAKKISAKALASLYPSTQWRTRNVINSAVTKVQKAYDEEFQRLQSLQQTYQSVMKFGNIAGEAYGSFRKAKMAGYEGNMFNYGAETAEVQGVWEDKYKTYNKQVMDETNNELTLDKLYRNLKKSDKGNTVKNLAEQFKVSEESVDEKTGVSTSSGISDLVDYYTKGGKPETPEFVSLETKDGKKIDVPYDVAQSLRGRKRYAKYLTYRQDEEGKGNEPKSWEDFDKDKDWKNVKASSLIGDLEELISKKVGEFNKLFEKKEKKPEEDKESKSSGLLGMSNQTEDKEFDKFGTNPKTGEQDKYRIDEDGTIVWQNDTDDEVVEDEVVDEETVLTDEDEEDYSIPEVPEKGKYGAYGYDIIEEKHEYNPSKYYVTPRRGWMSEYEMWDYDELLDDKDALNKSYWLGLDDIDLPRKKFKTLEEAQQFMENELNLINKGGKWIDNPETKTTSQLNDEYWNNQSNIFGKKDYNFENPDNKLAFMDETMNMTTQEKMDALNKNQDEAPTLEEMYATIDDTTKTISDSGLNLGNFWNRRT